MWNPAGKPLTVHTHRQGRMRRTPAVAGFRFLWPLRAGNGPPPLYWTGVIGHGLGGPQSSASSTQSIAVRRSVLQGGGYALSTRHVRHALSACPQVRAAGAPSCGPSLMRWCSERVQARLRTRFGGLYASGVQPSIEISLPRAVAVRRPGGDCVMRQRAAPEIRASGVRRALVCNGWGPDYESAGTRR